MEVYVSLNQVPYSRKPTNEIPNIKYRVVENWIRIGVGELAQEVGNCGCAIVPAHMIGGIKAENCVAMQLFVLDFDDGIPFGQVRERCDNFGIPISFAYHTSSSTREKEKMWRCSPSIKNRGTQSRKIIVQMYQNGFNVKQIAMCTGKKVNEVKAILETEQLAPV